MVTLAADCIKEHRDGALEASIRERLVADPQEVRRRWWQGFRLLRRKHSQELAAAK